MLTLDVEEQRTRYRILAGADGLQARRHAVDGGHLQTVTVLVIEAQTEDAHRIGLGIQSRQGLGVVTGDLDDATVAAQVVAGIALDLGVTVAAGVQHLLLEDLTRAVVGGRDDQYDLLVGQIGVDLGPAGIGVGDQLAVLGDLGGGSGEDVLRGQSELTAVGARGEDDAVIAEHDLEHLVDAVGSAVLELAGTNGA